MTEPAFAISRFKTVFDPAPQQSVISLGELTEELQHFLVKADLSRLIERELRLVESAVEAFEAGMWQAGPQLSALRRARDEAEERGDPVGPAVDQAAEKLRHDASKTVKERLPCWSPTVYREGSKRGSPNVLELSCLVLDYDDGSDLDDASRTWESWFHIVHTSWSHTPERPRFRLVLPLARPVPVSAWQRVWLWAEEYCGMLIDPRCKGAGRMWTLPAMPRPDAPHRAFSHGGPLLDPLLEMGTPSRKLLHASRSLPGIPVEPAPPPAPPPLPAPAPPAAPTPAPTPPPVPTPAASTLQPRPSVDDAATLVGLLERLAALHKDGELTDSEFALLNKRLL